MDPVFEEYSNALSSYNDDYEFIYNLIKEAKQQLRVENVISFQLEERIKRMNETFKKLYNIKNKLGLKIISFIKNVSSKNIKIMNIIYGIFMCYKEYALYIRLNFYLEYMKTNLGKTLDETTNKWIEDGFQHIKSLNENFMSDLLLVNVNVVELSEICQLAFFWSTNSQQEKQVDKQPSNNFLKSVEEQMKKYSSYLVNNSTVKNAERFQLSYRTNNLVPLRENISPTMNDLPEISIITSTNEINPLSTSNSAPLSTSSSAPLSTSSSALLRESSSAPLREYSSAPLREYSSAPLREYSSAPLRESSSAPLRESGSASLREYSSALLGEYRTTPLRENRNFKFNEQISYSSQVSYGHPIFIHPQGNYQMLQQIPTGVQQYPFSQNMMYNPYQPIQYSTSNNFVNTGQSNFEPFQVNLQNKNKDPAPIGKKVSLVVLNNENKESQQKIKEFSEISELSESSESSESSDEEFVPQKRKNNVVKLKNLNNPKRRGRPPGLKNRRKTN